MVQEFAVLAHRHIYAVNIVGGRIASEKLSVEGVHHFKSTASENQYL